MILIVSEEIDSHAQWVSAALARHGYEHALFDAGRFPLTATISWTLSPTLGTCVDLDGIVVPEAGLESVWYRRPGKMPTVNEWDAGTNAWAAQERDHLLGAVWDQLQARWVSRPASIRRASYKLVQLRVAQQLGFAVPPYLATNDPKVAESFIEAAPGAVIVKCLGTPTVVRTHKANSRDEFFSLYTHLIASEDRTRLGAVSVAPTFFQHFVEKVADVRVTIIGTRVFAVRIDSNADRAADVDLRRADIWTLRHVPIELPSRLEHACRALVDRLEPGLWSHRSAPDSRWRVRLPRDQSERTVVVDRGHDRVANY